ncbi:MAG: hypothetical protein AAFN77_20785 [Planctomycetota bacterium]
MSYPKRPKFFAAKFCRVLTKAAAAMDIGPETCWMLTVIAMQEDSCRYRKPVNYWNEQLMTLCGFRSRKRLITARSKAVDFGWLVYIKGGNRKPGKYWVQVPHPYSIESDSGPCCEPEPKVQRPDSQPEPKVQRPDSQPEQEFSAPNRGALRGANGAPSIPNPNPKEKGRTKFIPPTIQQVEKFASEYKLEKSGSWPIREFDPEAFHDHYVANGWKQSNGNPIKDWKATVRSWGRRDFGKPVEVDTATRI